MKPRGRHIWLGFFGIAGAFLAFGAWNHSPGQDPDNQGGYVLVLLAFLVLLFIYVPAAMRGIGARLRSAPADDVPPPGGA